MKRFTKVLSILLLSFAMGQSVDAQIVQFSQYYSSSPIVGPSFAGLNGGTRASFNYRDQWPGIPGKFVTYAFAFDHFLKKKSSGIGMYMMRDEAGTGNLSSTDIALQYNYEIKINKKTRFRPGIALKYTQRNIDIYRLIFRSQIKDFNEIDETNVNQNIDKAGYLDATFSSLIYSKNYWAGFTIDHLMRPNQSMTGGESIVPLYMSFYGGYRVDLKNRRRRKTGENLTFTMHYKMQEDFKQLDFGAYYGKGAFVAGLWYRGLPVLSNEAEGYYNNDAVIIMLGYKFYSLSIGYSYDITVSDLMKNSSGSHEVSIIYDFNLNFKGRKRRPRGAVSCPSFL